MGLRRNCISDSCIARLASEKIGERQTGGGEGLREKGKSGRRRVQFSLLMVTGKADTSVDGAGI